MVEWVRERMGGNIGFHLFLYSQHLKLANKPVELSDTTIKSLFLVETTLTFFYE